MAIERDTLANLYSTQKLSMKAIAKSLECSEHKVAYWMDKYQIPRRTISEAVYQKHNPDGDPFTVRPILTVEEAWLVGLGVGLYWGEGTKANKWSVRLGNSDPALIKYFISFLTTMFGVKLSDLRFGLQLFTDINTQEALNFWARELNIDTSQFYKPHITITGKIGNYKKKSKFGVVTLYYHNKKLRDIIFGMLPR